MAGAVGFWREGGRSYSAVVLLHKYLKFFSASLHDILRFVSARYTVLACAFARHSLRTNHKLLKENIVLVCAMFFAKSK